MIDKRTVVGIPYQLIIVILTSTLFYPQAMVIIFTLKYLK